MDLPNPNRIDLENPADVLLWADVLAISVERLHEVAARVGPMAAAVRFYASKTPNEPKGGGTVTSAIAGSRAALIT